MVRPQPSGLSIRAPAMLRQKSSAGTLLSLHLDSVLHLPGFFDPVRGAVLIDVSHCSPHATVNLIQARRLRRLKEAPNNVDQSDSRFKEIAYRLIGPRSRVFCNSLAKDDENLKNSHHWRVL
jgi:hypothetical protein